MITRIARCLFVLSAIAAPALAQDKPAGPAKDFSGTVKFEVQNDWVTRSRDTSLKRNDMFGKIEAETEARLAPALSFKSQVTFEPVSDPEPGKDRFFGDQGAFLEKAYLEYDGGAFNLRGGKFGQKLGIAWDAAPGIWGRDLAKEYELAEQVGFAADWNFGSGDSGKHVATIGTFFADTSVLSESVITNRHRTRHAAGGAGNTQDFSNFSIALEGGELPAIPGARYHVAATSRAGDGAGEVTEQGFSGTVEFKFKLGALEATPLIEYTGFTDRNGVSGTDVGYLVTALRFDYGKWTLALARTAKRTVTAGAANDTHDQQSQATVGYGFDGGVNLQVGYRNAEDSGNVTDTYGFLVDYTLKF